MAEAFGIRLLADVEAVGFHEILQNIRTRHGSDTTWFNFKPFDDLIRIFEDHKSISHHYKPPPIFELTSIAPGGGKTHLLYHLTSIAILPTLYGGKESSVVIIDAEGTLSVPRLAQQLRLVLNTNHRYPDEADTEDIIVAALDHVHIFRPQSMRSTIGILEHLPQYLLHTTHSSLDRGLAFIALDSATAFYWQTRAEEEDAAFAANTASTEKREAPAGYAQLSAAIKNATTALQCPCVIAAWHLAPSCIYTGAMPRALRPSLPAPFAQLPLFRLIVRRVPVPKFPAGITVAEALRQADDRLKIVDRGRFECAVNEHGVNAQTLQALRGIDAGFDFRIIASGLVVEQDASNADDGGSTSAMMG